MYGSFGVFGSIVLCCVVTVVDNIVCVLWLVAPVVMVLSLRWKMMEGGVE